MLHSSQELLGKVLGGCTLERLLGQGGMGAVYLARQERPSRYVAVKVLLPNMMMNSQMQEQYLARFRREANIVARLEHVNIVPIYAYGEQDGLAYIVSDFLEGPNLDEWLRGNHPTWQDALQTMVDPFVPESLGDEKGLRIRPAEHCT